MNTRVELVWRLSDMKVGLCKLSQVGTVRVSPQSAELGPLPLEASEPVVPPAVTIPEIRQDARRAYEALGKVTYLKTHSKFFNKLLVQVLCEAPPPQLVQIVIARGETYDVVEPSPNFVEPDEESFLKTDVLQAYQELGGYNYLLENPRLVEDILARLIKKPVVTMQSALIIDLQKRAPWMDFTNRLSYQRESSVSEVTDVVPRLSTKDPEPGAKN